MGAGVETVKAAFAAYLAGDLDGVFERAHDDVEFFPAYAQGASFTGKESVRSFFEAGRDPRERWSPIDLRFEEVGDEVLVAGRIACAPMILGSTFEFPIAWTFRVENGLIRRMRGFIDERTARSSLQQRNEPDPD